MPLGLLGKKLGMTHIYDQYGRHLAVTAVQAGPCTILRLRTPERDGYHAVQMGFEPVQETTVSKPRLGQFKQAGAGPFRYVHEFRVPPSPHPTQTPGEGKTPPNGSGGWTVGQQLTVALFKQYELVDVRGVSIGKGFQGGMKRWGWSGGPASHGSTSHRAPGSIGSSTFPGRVLRGHHLPGHMGARQVTIQNLRIVGLDPTANLLLVEGAIPGAEQSLVVVEKSAKRFEVVKAPPAIVVVAEEEETTKRGKTKRQ